MKKKDKDDIEISQLASVKKETVCAVVVTYNRKVLLLECLEALRKQTRPLDAIYIIDNASTDGTPEILLKNNYIPKLPQSDLIEPCEIYFLVNNLQKSEINSQLSVIVHYVRMHENTGGAGGFHEGVKRGYEKGYDWLWLMDDDGIPNKDCLNNLIFGSNKFSADFLAPLVLDINDPKKLSFGIYDYRSKRLIKSLKEAVQYSQNGFFEGTANPFNGILIYKELVRVIGYPKKEMFIWGDETEYLLRAKKNGFKIATVTNAIHKHPKIKAEFHKIFFGNFTVAYNNEKLRDYCKFRNVAYICKKYGINKLLLINILKYIWFFIFSRKFDLRNLFFYLSATIDGLKGDFSKHRYFIKKY